MTDRLAQWASHLQSSDIPTPLRENAQTNLLDTIGVCIAGSGSRVGEIARAVGLQSATQGWSSVLGTTERVAPGMAAFINGAAAHALDFDDNCYAGVVHGSAVIAPAALAVAQQTGATGQELITAFVAGSECEYLLGAASKNVLYERGWWTTGVLGPVGACIAVSRLLKLSPAEITSALGLALTGAGGTKACFGSDGKALMAGRASEAGVICALLAARGAQGPVDAIESTNGFVNLFNEGQLDLDVFDTLGSRWFSQSPGVDIKRIPVCLSSHAAVDAVMHLVQTHAIGLNEIERIVCDVPPIVCLNLIYDHPRTVQESQFSMSYAMAVSLKFGTLTLAHLEKKWLDDEALVSLMARTHMHTGPLWDDAALKQSAPEGADVHLHLTNGKVLRLFRARARGAMSDPLSSQEINQKFMGCTTARIGAEQAENLLSRLHRLDSDIEVRHLFETGGVS